nr:hypothetical protein [Tanacetum cinerariifolium]
TFQPKLLHSSEHKLEPSQTKEIEAKYNKVKAKLDLSSSSTLASRSSLGKKGRIVETYDSDEEEISSDDNEVNKVKALMALADEERFFVGKESAKNSEWIKISMKKVRTLLEMEDNDDSKSFLDYLCIVLNYVEEQRNNLISGPKDPGFVKSSANNSEVSIIDNNKLKLSEAEDSTLSNLDTTSAKGNKSSSASKTNLAPGGKLKNVKMEDDPPLAIVMKELNELRLKISKNTASYLRNKNSQHVPPNALQKKIKPSSK